MDLGVQTSVLPNPDPGAIVPQFSTSWEARERQPPEGPDPRRDRNDASPHHLLGQSLARCPFSKHLKQGRSLKKAFPMASTSRIPEEAPSPPSSDLTAFTPFPGLRDRSIAQRSREYTSTEHSPKDTRKGQTTRSFDALVSAPRAKRREVPIRPQRTDAYSARPPLERRAPGSQNCRHPRRPRCSGSQSAKHPF